MSISSFKNVIYKICIDKSSLIYMYKQDLALNNLQGFYAMKPDQPTKLYNCLQK